MLNKYQGLTVLAYPLARIDYAPYGLNPPHTHPHATEILIENIAKLSSRWTKQKLNNFIS
ncbi:hypothetical protein PTKIN_Ptkin06aG0164000 [Pterospermum kingtungense]